MKQIFTLLCALVVQSPAAKPDSGQAERLPNVVIFLADDQGWGDLSIHGNTNLATPHVDSLARDGISFENFYVCAVCAPTRAEFLTGRYHSRTGVGGVSRGEGRLNPDETTIANVFKAAGYATGAFGKWHNGTQTPYHPNDRGFDEFYGFTSGHWGHYFSPPLDHNGKRVRGKGYVVDDFTDHALRFIKEQRDKPFFCYLPYNTPHSPMMVDDRFYEKFAGVDPGMRHRDPQREDIPMTRAALAMCENIDWNVGRILKQLDDLKLRDNTIVLYFSDNGPNSYRWNGGMKGRKSSVDEGGLRSPLFIRWPDRIKPGSRVKQVTGAIDLLPSLADFAGIPAGTAKPMDGASFASLLGGRDKLWKGRNLFSLWGKKSSVRTERFRLDSAGKLYDIGKDRGQRINVAVEHPADTARLQRVLSEHRARMADAYAPFKNRPFTVGYGRSTTLPARDGIANGSIERSSKAPNNSFFKNWTKEDDSITWKVDVGQTADYEATVYYTCAKQNVGVRLRLSLDGSDTGTEANVTQAFNPPLYDKSKERVTKSHYFQKDFKPFELGTLRLKKGTGTLRLTAPKIVGDAAIDLYSISLVRK
jgi:arylsulfatase A-like enzyme